MYCHSMGQYRKHRKHDYTDLVCLTIPREVCNVIEDKQRFHIGPTKGNRFCECEIRLLNAQCGGIWHKCLVYDEIFTAVVFNSFFHILKFHENDKLHCSM